MARYIGPKCRQCRREGEKLFLKGERCYGPSCAIERRAYAPGQHGQGRQKQSEYGLQLREKQKAKRIYGILEKQFRSYFDMADSQKGVTGENLLRVLELRLDNVAYRSGLGRSRTEARQIVRHNLITVNGKKANIPSMQLKVGDVVEVVESAKSYERFKQISEATASRVVPEWMEADIDELTGKVIDIPSREQIDTEVQETLIVELYSK